MKHSLKYTLVSAVLCIAAFSSGPVVSAQNLPTGTYEEKNGIAYAKRATINDDGTYTIDLEAFVTGEVTQTMVSTPADIVLVLDVSGSMADPISDAEYSRADVSSLTYSSNAGVTNYYYLYNNNYYQVTVGSAQAGWWSSATYYFLSFTTNQRTYYITTDGRESQNRPENVTSPTTNLLNSNVTLYVQTQAATTKMDALKTAVGAFIEEVQHNDLYDSDDNLRETPLGNQISIVKFATNYYGNSASITPGNHFTNLNGNSQGDSSTNAHEYNCTEVLVGFTKTATTDNVSALKSAVNGLEATGATAADYGMNLARMLINSLGSDREGTNKTVVFFTDGEPNHINGFNTTVATDAIDYSRQIKAITYTSGEGDDQTTTHPSVFSVGVFDSTPSAGSNLDNFMNYISSNYPDATAYNRGGDKASSDYYMDASGGSADDLKKIFEAIAKNAGGSGNTTVSGGSAITVDVVSTSFSVPTGGSNAVTVLVAPCNGITTINGKDYLTFGEEKEATQYGLPAITAQVNASTNTVSTTGFDFSDNWCGPDPTSTSAVHNYAYHGYKQIIRFVITVNEDAVGGPSVATNDSGSGIYLEGSDEPIVTFNRPTVKLPVSIWIQKVGLEENDSAVFTIYRYPFNEDYPDFDPSAKGAIDPATGKAVSWEHFTKVMITKDDIFIMDGEQINGKKVTGLSPDYYYRLKEDAWAWTYKYQVNNELYTVGENVPENPFVFVNEPKEVKGSEAFARNVFTERTSD